MADQHMLRDAEFEALMKIEGTWFGFAPRSYRGEIIDGRRRIAAASWLCVRVPESVEIPNAIEVARWLALQRHFDRSLAWQRERLGSVVPLYIPRELAAELASHDRIAEKAIARRRIKAREGKLRHRRKLALDRVNWLLQNVQQRGYGASAFELQEALREFVDERGRGK